jgi:hypothetical protein
MIRFAADEDFSHDIVRALRRSLPVLDIVTIHDAGGRGWPDPRVLEWAAAERRVLLTHDVNTMIGHARKMVERGETLSGLVVVHQRLPVGDVLEDLVLIATCSNPEEWIDQVQFLPLAERR